MLRILINIVIIALVCGCSRREDYRPWVAAAMGRHVNEDILVAPPIVVEPEEAIPEVVPDEVSPCPLPVADSPPRSRRKIIRKIFRRRR